MFASIERVADYVAKVDAAVAALEIAVADSRRADAVRSLRTSMAPLSRLFGVDAQRPPLPPFVRPPASNVAPFTFHN